jgi:predicted transcriptional regulator
MVKKANRNIIVLAIHPQYGKAILQGTKRVEFRRNGVPESVSGIVLYATSPVQGILGFVEISDCIIASPSQLWKMFGSSGMIPRKVFLDYYKNYKIGKCYLISRVFSFQESIELKKWTGLSKPPQSFAYLEDEKWLLLKNQYLLEQAGKKGLASS